MSDEENELSDEEYDALLRDLEGRAGDGAKSGDRGASAADDEVDDIDAFLSDIESQSEADAQTKTATADDDDDLAREFAALEQKGELTAPDDGGRKEKAEESNKDKGSKNEKKKAKAKDSTTDEAGQGRLELALKIALTAAWVVPALTLWWVVGAYLGMWVSAAWLIGLVGAAVVFGTPLVLKRLSKRGNYRRWLIGFSLLATVALLAPVPNMAAEKLNHYGHWPSSVVAELTGAGADTGMVRAHASAAGWIGGWIATEESDQWQARQLGTVFPLEMQWPPDPETMELLEEGGPDAPPETGPTEPETPAQPEATDGEDELAP